MAAGKALAFEETARQALDNKLSGLDDSQAMAMMRSNGEDEIKKMGSKHPALQGALDRVHDLERRVTTWDDDDAAGLLVDRGENKRGAAQLQDILKNGESTGISNDDRKGLNDVMDLLLRHQRRNQKMSQMLDDIPPDAAGERNNETANNVQDDLQGDEDVIGALADKLQELVMRESSAKLTRGNAIFFASSLKS